MKPYILLILKPGFKDKFEEVKQILDENDIEIKNVRKGAISQKDVEEHYLEHFGKPFYNTLCDYMTHGKLMSQQFDNTTVCFVGISKAENEDHDTFIKRVRVLVKTKIRPQFALKKEYCTNITDDEFKEINMTANVIHASDSPESAHRETLHFFPEFFNQKDNMIK